MKTEYVAFSISPGWLCLQVKVPVGFTSKIEKLERMCKAGRMPEVGHELQKMLHYQCFRLSLGDKTITIMNHKKAALAKKRGR